MAEFPFGAKIKIKKDPGVAGPWKTKERGPLDFSEQGRTFADRSVDPSIRLAELLVDDVEVSHRAVIGRAGHDLNLQE